MCGLGNLANCYYYLRWVSVGANIVVIRMGLAAVTVVCNAHCGTGQCESVMLRLLSVAARMLRDPLTIGVYQQWSV